MNKQESRKLDADIANIMALSSKYGAETEKLNREGAVYPFIVGSFVTIVIVAIIEMFL